MPGTFEIGAMPIPALSVVLEAAGEIAEAARSVYDAWDQGADGFDEELGAGGICQDVAAATVEVLARKGVEHACQVHAAVGENHVFVVALLDDGVYSVDIPPWVYETGGGYVWKKRQDAQFLPESVGVERIGGFLDPEEFERTYLD